MAHIRMWAGDYTLSGLVGFELRCKTVGIVGTGAIGAAAARIFCVSPSDAGLLVLCSTNLRGCLCMRGATQTTTEHHLSGLVACGLRCKTAGLLGKRAADSAAPHTFCALIEFPVSR